MPAKPLPSELWDVDRLSSFLGCSRHFVYRLTRERRIDFVRVGKELRFDPASVAAWLDAGAHKAASGATAPKRRPGRPRQPR